MIQNLYKIFDEFVSDEKASDLHIRSDIYPVMRSKNSLQMNNKYPVLDSDTVYEYIEEVFKIRFGKDLGLKKYEEFRYRESDRDGANSEVDLAIMIPNSSYRARVNIFKSLNKPGFVMRKIPNKMPILTDLGFYDEHLQKIKEIVKRKEGLVLVTGQTGSGKSTTLAAIIDYVNKTFDKHIVTIEDPVEFVHKSQKSVITHREVHSDTDTFYSGLKASLRQDPDIILVGEIRDEKTAMAALQAAQTGHIVFATLHTNSAPETIIRFLDMFPANKAKSIKVSLAASLRMILSQKLAPTISNNRVLLYEMLINSTSIQNLIIKDDFSDVEVYSKMNENRHTEHKMLPLENCIEKRVKESDPDRRISIDTAYEFANNKERIKSLLKIDDKYSGDTTSSNSDSSIPSGFFGRR